jgi:hypothetical protein
MKDGATLDAILIALTVIFFYILDRYAVGCERL